jgi:hypothetical protein
LKKETALALYDVTAVALSPHTGEVAAGPRVERIDTDTNELFTGCNREWEVEDAYEAFWNRLNQGWEADFPLGKHKVKVLTATRVQKPARERWVELIRSPAELRPLPRTAHEYGRYAAQRLDPRRRTKPMSE